MQQALERHLQDLLDGMAGVDRTHISIDVKMAAGVGVDRRVPGTVRDIAGGLGLEQVSVHLTVDPMREEYDAASGEFSEVERGDEEIEKLAAIAAKALILRPDLGDQITTSIASLREIRDRNRRQRDTAAANAKRASQHKLWKKMAIAAAITAGLVVALLGLRMVLGFLGSRRTRS